MCHMGTRMRPVYVPWWSRTGSDACDDEFSMNERIWDKFLTERDKAVFAAGGFGARAGFGKRPALLVIDVNWAFWVSPRATAGDCSNGWIVMPEQCDQNGRR